MAPVACTIFDLKDLYYNIKGAGSIVIQLNYTYEFSMRYHASRHTVYDYIVFVHIYFISSVFPFETRMLYLEYCTRILRNLKGNSIIGSHQI